MVSCLHYKAIYFLCLPGKLIILKILKHIFTQRIFDKDNENYVTDLSPEKGSSFIYQLHFTAEVG